MSINLNALVAERVMGWTWWSARGKSHLCPQFVSGYQSFQNGGHFCPGKTFDAEPIENIYSTYSHLKIPNFSGDIACAWLLVDKLSASFRCDIVCIPRYFPSVRFTNGTKTGEAEGDSVPMAICLAALRAVGATDAEIEEAMR